MLRGLSSLGNSRELLLYRKLSVPTNVNLSVTQTTSPKSAGAWVIKKTQQLCLQETLSVQNRGARIKTALIQHEKGSGGRDGTQNISLILGILGKNVCRNVSGFFKCNAKIVTLFPNISCSNTVLLWKKVSVTTLSLFLQY